MTFAPLELGIAVGQSFQGLTPWLLTWRPWGECRSMPSCLFASGTQLLPHPAQIFILRQIADHHLVIAVGRNQLAELCLLLVLTHPLLC